MHHYCKNEYSESRSMNKNSVTFYQGIIVLIGIGSLVLMLWEPHWEGRNVNSSLLQIYFNDPFLAYAYVSSIAFFAALFQTSKLLGHFGQQTHLSRDAVRIVTSIKYCSLILVGSIVLPEVYLFIARPDDDIAGGVVIGLVLIIVFAVLTAVSANLEKHLKNEVEKESES